MKKTHVMVLVLIVSILISAFLILNVLTLKAKIKHLDKIVDTQSETVNKLKEKTEIGDCEDEQNTILKKDMEIYIKRRYTKTPRVIAKAVAKNIIFHAKKYKLPPELILGITEVESMFNPLTESSKGARGLMQVMPEWVPKLDLQSVNDLYEIDLGIDSGIRVFLIHLEEAKGNISGGLYRYVNKDKSYVERVYSAVGRFVTYRTTLDSSDRIAEKEENGSNKRTELHNERTPEPDV
ncbi:MAG: lytic transglycosylase domain-containing protein [Candidatus Thorarchaeota archaeon]